MELDPAYVAGFFDGDGSVGIYKNTSLGYYLRTQITQNIDTASTALYEALQERWGGNVGEQRTYTGRLKYNWQVNGDLAVAFLRDIVPHLIIRKLQAELGIKWQEGRAPLTRNEKGHIQPRVDLERDEAYASELRRLKKVELIESEIAA